LCRQTSLSDVDVIRFQQLVTDKHVNINFNDPESHDTPMLLLCRFNNSQSLYPCLKLLLTREDLNLNCRTIPHFRNSLMLLCRYYTLENELIDCIRLLIKRGVDCNKKSSLNRDGETALFLLTSYARPSKYLIDVVRLLINEESDFENATKSAEILLNRGHKREADDIFKLIQSYRLGHGSIPNEVIFISCNNC